MLISYTFAIEHVFNSDVPRQRSCIDARCFSQNNEAAAVEKGGGALLKDRSSQLEARGHVVALLRHWQQ